MIEGAEAVKVGVTTDLRSRLAQLQTGSPHALRLAWSLAIAGDAYAVEAEAHRTLARHRVSGEWFRVECAVAVAAVSAAAYQAGERPSADTQPRGAPNWPKRIGLVALAFTPSWAALTAGLGVVALPLLFFALIAMVAGLQRSRARFGMGLRTVAGWVGTILTGMVVSMIFGLVAGSAHAQSGVSLPTYDPNAYCTNIAALFGGAASAKDNCLASEAASKIKVDRVWAQTPDGIKDLCVRTGAVAGTSSNYTALSGCLALRVGGEWLDGHLHLVH